MLSLEDSETVRIGEATAVRDAEDGFGTKEGMAPGADGAVGGTDADEMLKEEETGDDELATADLHSRMNLHALAADADADGDGERGEANPERTAVLKLVLTLGLYPNFAVPDPHNANRPLNEHQFVTRHRDGLGLLASCSLSHAAVEAQYAQVCSTILFAKISIYI